MATEIKLTSADVANAPTKLGSPPDFGTLYSGRALDFDGVVDYFSTPSINMGTVHTFSCWVKLVNTAPEDGNRSFLSVDGSYFALYYAASSDKIQYANGGAAVTSTDTLSLNTWTHMVVTRNERAVNFYFNGVIDSGGELTLAGDAVLSGIFKISSISGSSDFVDGNMANLQFWDAAWSLSDVQYAYTHPEKFASDTPGTSLTTSNQNQQQMSYYSHYLSAQAHKTW